MTYYKVLKYGRSFCGGNFTWSLPKGDQPGEWHEVEGKVVPCSNGFHVTTDPAYWISCDQCDIYIVEVDGRIIKEQDKVVAKRARLIRKLTRAEERSVGYIRNVSLKEFDITATNVSIHKARIKSGLIVAAEVAAGESSISCNINASSAIFHNCKSVNIKGNVTKARFVYSQNIRIDNLKMSSGYFESVSASVSSADHLTFRYSTASVNKCLSTEIESHSAVLLKTLGEARVNEDSVVIVGKKCRYYEIFLDRHCTAIIYSECDGYIKSCPGSNVYVHESVWSKEHEESGAIKFSDESIFDDLIERRALNIFVKNHDFSYLLKEARS